MICISCRILVWTSSFQNGMMILFLCFLVVLACVFWISLVTISSCSFVFSTAARMTAALSSIQILRRSSLTKNFRTQYDPYTNAPSNPGSRFKIDYVATRDDSGRLNLEECGRTDTYAVIQSYRESTDLAVIISRFLSGDATALSRNPAFYGDVVGVPTNLNDALRVIESAERDFKALDPAIQQRFDNDFGVYVSMMDNPAEFALRFKGEPAPDLDNGGDKGVQE